MTKTQQSKPEDSPRGGSDRGEPPDPNERLSQLQHELDQHNTRISHLTAQRDALNQDINDLSATVQQVKTTLINYAAGLTDVHTRFHALDYFYEQKSKMILAAIGDKKGPIDELIHEFDSEIDRMQERLRELNKKQNEAQAESDEAIAVQKERQQEYDAANDYQQKVAGMLTDMEGLRSQITDADDKTDVASMYFLVGELHQELRETQIMSQHELALELRRRLGELETAKETARAKSAALGNLQNEYNDHKTKLDTKRSGRRQALLTQVRGMFPVPTSSGGTDTSSATGSTGASSSAGATAAASGPATPSTGTSSPAATQKK